MRWIQATLTFHPYQINRFRAGQFGVWRVHHCAEVGNPLTIRVDNDMIVGMKYDYPHPDNGYVMLGKPVMRIMVKKPYRPGVMVNPRKLLKEWKEACRK